MPSSELSPYTKAFASVWETLSETNRGWDYLFTNEKIDLTIAILEKMSQAYEEAAETPFEPNPYLKDPDVIEIIERLRRAN